MTVGSTWMAAHYTGDKDCAIVAMLKRQGAIPMVRGNLPQYCMAGHTDNHIFGRAKNPYDNDRTCGGSSGGDAGLVASKCVPFAVGSDIGGSIRCPASCNGIIGFKPTAYRSTLDGMLFPSPGYGNDQSAIKSTAGPLCNSVADVKMYFESMWEANFFAQNADVPPMPFREDAYSKTLEKKMKIGFLCYTNANGQATYGLESLPISKGTERAIKTTC